MTRLIAPGAAAAAALLAAAGAALALPPEPASAPRNAHIAPPPAAVAGSSQAAGQAAGQAQGNAPGITPDGKSKGPMDITAEGVETIQPQHLTIFKGNVEVIQDQARLRTPELRVFNKPKAAAGTAAGPAAPAGGPLGSDSGSIDHIEAAGPVYYITPTQNARGDYMLYEADPDTITLTGHVVLEQGKSVARGDKFIMFRKTGQNQLISNAPTTPTGRVRVILYPQQQQAAAKPAAPAR